MKKGLIPQGLNLAGSVGLVLAGERYAGILWRDARFLWKIRRVHSSKQKEDGAVIPLLPPKTLRGLDKVHFKAVRAEELECLFLKRDRMADSLAAAGLSRIKGEQILRWGERFGEI